MRKSKGFGLLELMVVLVVLSLLVTLAIPAYDRYAHRGRVNGAIGHIGSIDIEIGKFRLQNNDALPLTLADLGVDIPLDPWGQPYVFVNIVAAGPGFGGFRKDKNLNPLNTDYDLYSVGKDGETQGPLSAKASHDDIVRANDGAYVGLGEDY